MDWKSIGKKLAGIGLPALGTAVGGPAGAQVGRVVGERLGLSDAKPDDVRGIIDTSNPEALRAQFGALEAYHKSAAAVTESLVKDRIDARSDAPLSWWQPRTWMAVGSLVLVVVVSSMAFRLAITDGNGSATEAEMLMIGTVVGYAFALCQTCYNFLFGGSERS